MEFIENLVIDSVDRYYFNADIIDGIAEAVMTGIL